jgi:hypothetical protein
LYFGLSNIFKVFRIDFAARLENKNEFKQAFRITIPIADN